MTIDSLRKQGHPLFYDLIEFIKDNKVEETTSPRYYELLYDMAEVHARKNAGYAGKNASDPLANLRMANKIGIPTWQGAMVRWTDKVIRISNLIKDPTADMVGESLVDTLIDLANYSLLIYIMLEEELGEEISIMPTTCQAISEIDFCLGLTILVENIDSFIFPLAREKNIVPLANELLMLVNEALLNVIQLEEDCGGKITPEWLEEVRKENERLLINILTEDED